MRPLILGLSLVATSLSSSAEARPHSYRAHGHTSNGVGSGTRYYTATSGDRVYRPVRARTAPSAATARCYDGSYSFSESRGGTCSHHGGVAEWF